MGFARSEVASVSHIANQHILDALSGNLGIGRTIKSGLAYLKKIYQSTDLIRITYDESYCIGLDQFDGRRQLVVDGYNAFNAGLRRLSKPDGSATDLNDQAARLVQAIGDLFYFEEALMVEAEYSEQAAHRARHIRFLETLHDEFVRIQEGRADLHDLSYLIGSWLTEHMRDLDMAFGDFVVGAVSELARARNRSEA
jgi:hemerythrin-like metal-binding protein